MTCEPFAHVVLREKVCDWCMATKSNQEDIDPMRPCHECQVVSYCSTKCQDTARVEGNHGKECR